mmetsp:Transcript_35091/g.80028  ORF Transcript_35091/g.80028 Transcript_35091/m.80028 type:complete len:206 (+) Transcript_35091:241-858(+)
MAEVEGGEQHQQRNHANHHQEQHPHHLLCPPGPNHLLHLATIHFPHQPSESAGARAERMAPTASSRGVASIGRTTAVSQTVNRSGKWTAERVGASPVDPQTWPVTRSFPPYSSQRTTRRAAATLQGRRWRSSASQHEPGCGDPSTTCWSCISHPAIPLRAARRTLPLIFRSASNESVPGRKFQPCTCPSGSTPPHPRASSFRGTP